MTPTTHVPRRLLSIERPTAMQTYDTPAPITAVLDIDAGDVTIVASDRTDTVVRVEPSNAGKTADVKAADQTTIEFADGRLTVRCTKQWSLQSVFGTTGTIAVHIELPSESRVDGKLALGTFRAEGTLGDAAFKTSLGGVFLDETATTTVDTSMGDITVGYVHGRADLSTGTGEVRIGSLDGGGVIKNSNGDTRIEACENVRISSANGSITVGTARGDVHAKSANGNIRIDDAVEGSLVLETGMGGLDVGVRAGTAAWLDAKTQYGRVDSSLDSADSPTDAGRVVEIRSRTAMGDIVVRRSTVEEYS